MRTLHRGEISEEWKGSRKESPLPLEITKRKPSNCNNVSEYAAVCIWGYKDSKKYVRPLFIRRIYIIPQERQRKVS